MERRIGVYICHCGGNISDYVDVESVKKAIEKEDGVAAVKTVMFACSDSAQQEMIEDIKKLNLDGLVVASCSPKLHLLTFRGVARRAGLNPFKYIQVNIREQDSWAHRKDKKGATEKAVRLVRAGIAKALKAQELEPLKVNTVKRALVVGGGIAGLRAALAFSELGISVILVERENELGGWVKEWGTMYPHGRSGRDLINSLVEELKKRQEVLIITGAQLVDKRGSIGNFEVDIKLADGKIETFQVGVVVVATGFDAYTPKNGEFGFGMDGVITLPEFKKLVDRSEGKLVVNGKEVESIAYIYCVGSRQGDDVENPNRYCSRYCCTATVHTASEVSKKFKNIVQYHLYRDIRTYGKYEPFYETSSKSGSIFLRYSENDPPVVKRMDGKLSVEVRDLLTENEKLEIPVDLVVLVTGMVPRSNEKLVDTLKIPIGRDGFFNEIHPKLKPVETVTGGVFIAGTSQGPKNSSESVSSALAAVSKASTLLLKGYVELDPELATVDIEKCEWCGVCLDVCPYSAFEKVTHGDKEVARVIDALCKGCGACVPACPRDAIELKGYTDEQVKAMIDALLKEVEIG